VTDWFTAREIAALHKVSVVHIRNMASKDQWRRLGTRPQRYHILDVMETLGSAK
jgi:hypothetical protein